MGAKAIRFTRSCRTTPAMTNDRFLPFAFPAVASKKITAAFDGGRMTSDGRRITALAIASSTDFCESVGGLATQSAATSFVYRHSRSSFRSGSPVPSETMLRVACGRPT